MRRSGILICSVLEAEDTLYNIYSEGTVVTVCVCMNACMHVCKMISVQLVLAVSTSLVVG